MGMRQPPLLARLMNRNLSEAAWQKEVEETLTFFGYWWYHPSPNVIVCPKCRWKIFRGVRKGMPDILAIKPPHILWLELKDERGQLKPEQTEVGQMLLACGQTWRHARPRDREQLLCLITHPEAA